MATSSRMPMCPTGCAASPRSYGESYSLAVAPMLWEGAAIGSILVGRNELSAFRRQGAAAAAHVRRPGGDRDPERAPVQRDQGSTRPADRHRRSAGGHQQLGRRHPASLREDPRKLPAADRVHRSLGADGRRAVAGSCRCGPGRGRAQVREVPPDSARTVGDRRSDARAPRDELSGRAARRGRAGCDSPDGGRSATSRWSSRR